MLVLAGDHNLSETLLEAVSPFIPVEIILLPHIDPRLVDRLDDWQVLLALHQLGYQGMITLDDAMLALPKEMAVVHQTNFTLVVVEKAAHDPVRATGELLCYLTHIARSHDPRRPQVFKIPKRQFPGSEKAWDTLTRIADNEGSEVMDLFEREQLSPSELVEPVLP